jgi:hypothetical protein
MEVKREEMVEHVKDRRNTNKQTGHKFSREGPNSEY